jgi:hypothetical protein
MSASILERLVTRHLEDAVPASITERAQCHRPQQPRGLHGIDGAVRF